MDLTKLVLPSSVNVGGNFYDIHTEHPYWIRFSQLLQEENITFSDFDFLYISEKPIDKKAGFDALCSFYFEEKTVPKKDYSNTSNEIAYDYAIDADLIYSSILEQYHIDIAETPIHWHKFRALIAGLHNTKLNEIISYRLYEPAKKGDTYEKQMKHLKNLWHIPNKEDLEAEKVRNKFNEMLNGKKNK